MQSREIILKEIKKEDVYNKRFESWQILVYNPLTKTYTMYWADDRKAIFYQKHAFEGLRYFLLDKELWKEISYENREI